MKKAKKWIALAFLLTTMILGSICVLPKITKADMVLPPPDISSETVLKTHTVFVNGVKRTMTLTDLDGFLNRIYLKVGDATPNCVSSYTILDAGMDKNGVIFELSPGYLQWWSYDLSPNLSFIKWNTINADSGDPVDVESLVFEGTGTNATVVGYKTITGQVYPIPTWEEMKNIINPTPLPTPTPPAPSNSPVSMPTPTQSIAPTPTASASPTVTSEPVPTATAKPMYTLKKGTLTWKAGNKKGKAKNVIEVAYTKSDKLIFRDKKGRAYTVSQNGKKKLIVKKGTKKFIYVGTGKNRYVSKVKTKSKFVKVK